MLEVSIVSKPWFRVSWRTQKISVCNSLILPSEGFVELLNSSFSQMFCFKPLWLFIPQRGCWEHVLGDTGSDHCTHGVHCWSENREAKFSPFLERGVHGVPAQCELQPDPWNALSYVFSPKLLSLSAPALSMSIEIIFYGTNFVCFSRIT